MVIKFFYTLKYFITVYKVDNLSYICQDRLKDQDKYKILIVLNVLNLQVYI